MPGAIRRLKKSLPFELTGTHATVGRIDVSLVSHLEAIEGGVAPPQDVRVVIVTAPSGATGQRLRRCRSKRSWSRLAATTVPNIART